MGHGIRARDHPVRRSRGTQGRVRGWGQKRKSIGRVGKMPVDYKETKILSSLAVFADTHLPSPPSWAGVSFWFRLLMDIRKTQESKVGLARKSILNSDVFAETTTQEFVLQRDSSWEIKKNPIKALFSFVWTWDEWEWFHSEKVARFLMFWNSWNYRIEIIWKFTLQLTIEWRLGFTVEQARSNHVFYSNR